MTFTVAPLTAKINRTDTIGKKCIKPARKIMAIICSEINQNELLKKIPFANDSITCCLMSSPYTVEKYLIPGVY